MVEVIFGSPPSYRFTKQWLVDRINEDVAAVPSLVLTGPDKLASAVLQTGADGRLVVTPVSLGTTPIVFGVVEVVPGTPHVYRFTKQWLVDRINEAVAGTPELGVPGPDRLSGAVLQAGPDGRLVITLTSPGSTPVVLP